MNERCDPVVMRKALEMVHTMKLAGIEFVPVPVLDNEDRLFLADMVSERLEKIGS